MKKIIVTGGCGFIGSHLVESLLINDHYVTVVDNLSNGTTKNLFEAYQPGLKLDKKVLSRIQFFECDVVDFDAYKGADVVFHLAGLGSIPRSLEHPLWTHESNVRGTFMVLNRARKAGVKRVIYASSSSVYGDSEVQPRTEPSIGRQLSIYSATKRMNEIQAEAFALSYGMETMGLRYFNVYGPRQHPDGDYAAVIPKWIQAMKKNEEVVIYGDGSQTRDFTYVKDIVRANFWAMGAHPNMFAAAPILNIGTGISESLIRLFEILKQLLGYNRQPSYAPARLGDRKDSLASIKAAGWAIGYEPTYNLNNGLIETVNALK